MAKLPPRRAGSIVALRNGGGRAELGVALGVAVGLASGAALATSSCGSSFTSGATGGDAMPGEVDSSVGIDGPDGSGADAPGSGDASAGTDGTDPPPPCPGPDDTHGVFVETGSALPDPCGDPTHPCGTLAAALQVVTHSGGAKDIIYIRAGTYVEQVTLSAGVTLQGGWIDTSGTWTRPCTGPAGATAAAATVIQAPAGAGATVLANYAGSSTLDSLTLQSMDPSAVAPSQSVYGVFATGATTRLTLHDVTIALAGGGGGPAGGGGANGAPGAGAGGCSGPASGNAGGQGSAGRPGAAGTYGAATGFTPGAGGDGTAGGAGANGTAPAMPPTCADAGSGCEPMMQGKAGTFVCACGGALSSCGTAGAFGCGGGGAPGGQGGAGGGASIGVFDWDALVSLTGGAIATGAGGPGGNGGMPGAQGAGTAGVAGAAPSISVGLGDCFGVGPGTPPHSCLTCTKGFVSGQAGSAGGAGGAGGQGGQGGGGSGGDSYCFFQGGAGVVEPDPTVTCRAGAGGLGGNQGQANAGPAGASGLHN